MSGRKLGGGRILGSGRPLSPSAAAPKRNSSLLSPTPSTASLNSSSSTAQTSPELQDIASRISLDQGDGPNGATVGPAASASTRLFCPICNDEMVTLLQLNRHLDDNHKNLEEVKQDEVKDWFKTQMVKAKKFQPLAVLNQKFKGLDVFESNEPTTPPPSIHTTSSASTSTATLSKLPETPSVDPDEVVSKKHWQRPGPNDTCLEPTCGRRLNTANGKVNCRHCGKLFCEEHTMYQMKLSRSAQHEPVRGIWCRVCETCYKSRDGYNDRNGLEIDHTKEFANMRRKVVDKTFLEVSRLEKRLTRLTQLLANSPPEQTSGGLLWGLTASKANPRKQLEQSVVTWEDDATVIRCPFCQQEFSNYTFRRHHCRTCGRVVCGDLRTGCSSEVGLNIDQESDRATEKPSTSIGVDVRLCKDCKHTLFSKRDFAAEIAHKPPDVRSYENLVQFERGIRLMLPRFQRLLVALQDPDQPPSSAQLAEASKTRKRLMDAFTQYDAAARRIRDLPTTSESQKKLQKAIHQQSTNFLQLHMLPLKALPKVLKHASPHGASPLRPSLNGHLSPNGSRSNSALAAIKYNDIENASQVSSSSAISALEAEEKGLRERLIVLEEQRFFVQEMVASAVKRRKFDEVESLGANVTDLEKEIDGLKGQLGALDFEGAYAGGGGGGGAGSALDLGVR
ncbi:carboxypeptidase Y-deficient [Agyrium rufum]|nr:carboxypeptidase Y-deficient [Agyrium rufum]